MRAYGLKLHELSPGRGLGTRYVESDPKARIKDHVRGI